MERELARSIKVGADFLYINTARIGRQRDVNLPAPTHDATGRPIYSGTRPADPYFFIEQITESSARSLYRGFTTSLDVRRPPYTFVANYTLSWKYSHDDKEQDYSGIAYDDAFNLNNEYGPSNIDQRHQLIAHAMYSLPLGLEVASTARFTSGLPFSALDDFNAFDANRDAQSNDRPVINGKVLPRNTFRNRGFSDVSLRIQRHFHLPNEKGMLTASVEFFNLFGFDNVQIGRSNMIFGPGTVIKGGQPVAQAPPANFNQLRDSTGQYLRTNLVGDPFQLQLGLRFQF